MTARRYRVNYGNGQVSSSFDTLKAAERELERGRRDDGDPATTFVEEFIHEWGEEAGEWFPVRRSAT